MNLKGLALQVENATIRKAHTHTADDTAIEYVATDSLACWHYITRTGRYVEWRCNNDGDGDDWI